jgi:hypothetical protein
MKRLLLAPLLLAGCVTADPTPLIPDELRIDWGYSWYETDSVSSLDHQGPSAGVGVTYYLGPQEKAYTNLALLPDLLMPLRPQLDDEILEEEIQQGDILEDVEEDVEVLHEDMNRLIDRVPPPAVAPTRAGHGGLIPYIPPEGEGAIGLGTLIALLYGGRAAYRGLRRNGGGTPEPE